MTSKQRVFSIEVKPKFRERCEEINAEINVKKKRKKRKNGKKKEKNLFFP